MTKKCNKCQTIKYVSLFVKDKGTRSGIGYLCLDCNKLRYKENRENWLKRIKKHYAANKNVIKQQRKEHYATNVGLISKSRKLKYKNLTVEQKHQIYLKQQKYYMENKWRWNTQYVREYTKNRRRNDPKKRVHSNFSRQISLQLHGNRNKKAGRKWEYLVGYSRKDLMAHLEKQFTEGMTWGNYGKWHIDHIVPVSVFNFSSPEQIDFKRCWALKNLRPLWAKENISKNDKILKPFQPSLQI